MRSEAPATAGQHTAAPIPLIQFVPGPAVQVEDLRTVLAILELSASMHTSGTHEAHDVAADARRELRLLIQRAEDAQLLNACGLAHDDASCALQCACRSCGHHWDSSGDDPCPACGSGDVEEWPESRGH